MPTDTRTENEIEATNDNPFALEPPDENEELDALTRALDVINGFALFIASCNQAPSRDRLMNELEARLPNARIQRVAVQTETRNLIYLLRQQLETPVPDAVFVYGMESWLPAGKAAENSPFVLNLNAARNYFPADVPCPMVLWLPQHLVTAVAHGAPDFFSVRSGLYAFAPTPQAREQMLQSFASQNLTGVLGLPLNERAERIEQLTKMLHEYEALPDDLRDYRAESRILNSLATLQEALGNYYAAEPLYKRALAIDEKILGEDHPDYATGLNNLAGLYYAQGRHTEAEPLFVRALAIREMQLGPQHPGTAASLNNLGELYRSQGHHAKAEPLYKRALAIHEDTLGSQHPDTAQSLNNLASLYYGQGRFAEAESRFVRALAIVETQLGPQHSWVATSLNNLALLYYGQGRFAEAESRFVRATQIDREALGEDHPEYATDLNNLAWLYNAQGRDDEAAIFFARAKEAEEAHQRKNAAP